MRLTDAVFGRLIVDIREIFAAIPSELKSDLDGEFLTAIVEQPNDILKCAMYLFLGYLDGATQYVSFASRSLANVGRRRCAVGEAESYRPQFAQSCGGGGGDTSLPLGRKDDEDNRRFAYRCMMQAHKMLKPTQPKRGVGGRR